MGLTPTQIAYLCFDKLWKPYQYQDRYYNMQDFDYSECFSGCYNLVGFTTHNGQHPQQAQFAAVIEMDRDQWYHCTTDGIAVLTTQQVLSEFNGCAKFKDDPLQVDCQTADLLLYRKVYYEKDHIP